MWDVDEREYPRWVTCPVCGQVYDAGVIHHGAVDCVFHLRDRLRRTEKELNDLRLEIKGQR